MSFWVNFLPALRTPALAPWVTMRASFVSAVTTVKASIGSDVLSSSMQIQTMAAVPPPSSTGMPLFVSMSGTSEVPRGGMKMSGVLAEVDGELLLCLLDTIVGEMVTLGSSRGCGDGHSTKTLRCHRRPTVRRGIIASAMDW
jgi:hypothetical protein